MNRQFDVLSELLGSGGYIVVNKALAKTVGLYEAIVYAELLAKDKYFAGKNMLEDDGFFFNTADDMTKDTTLSEKQIRSAVSSLEKLELIETDVRNVPARKYYKINKSEDAMEKLFSLIAEGQRLQQYGKIVRTSMAKSADK